MIGTEMSLKNIFPLSHQIRPEEVWSVVVFDLNVTGFELYRSIVIDDNIENFDNTFESPQSSSPNVIEVFKFKFFWSE